MSARFVMPFADVGSGITPSSGAKLFFFESDGVTPKDTHTTKAATVANANPVIADSTGLFPSIYITGDYLVTLKNKNDSQIFGLAPVNEFAVVTDAAFVKSFATLAAAIADTGLVDGDTFKLTNDRGNSTWNVVLLTSVALSPEAPTLGNIVASTGDITLAFVLETNGTLIAEQWGIFGNNSGTPYTAGFIEFMDATASSDVTDATFPNKTITFNNTTPASFQSNCTYNGGRNTFIQPTVFTSRVFLTQSKTNFEIIRMRSYINEGAGGEDITIGGGYWRFESCTDFDTKHIEVSRSFSGGIKMVLCTGFTMKHTRCKYNQFTGLETEGCSDYDVENYDFSFNGKFSVDDTFKPLPTSFSGTHGGRGWNVGANANTIDQRFSSFRKGKCIQNSEFGIRAFAAGTKGITNLKIDTLLVEDNGHPAGTYGTVVLASDKGVDFLINSDPLGNSANITWENLTINRSLAFGQSISVDGDNHRQRSTVVNFTGAGKYIGAACVVFGGKGFISDGLISNGARIHWSFGSGLPTDVTFINDRGLDNLIAINGAPAAGVNSITNSYFQHRTTTAVAGELGIAVQAEGWELHELTFDGYFKGVELQNTAPIARITRVTTLNTVNANSGVAGSTVTDQTGLKMANNNFDTAFPAVFAGFTDPGDGPLGRKRVTLNANPATGGAGSGGNMAWVVGDRFDNSALSIDGNNMILTGWGCTAAGTPGTWSNLYQSNVTPAT